MPVLGNAARTKPHEAVYSHTTPSLSASRMNRYAGCERGTCAIPYERATRTGAPRGYHRIGAGSGAGAAVAALWWQDADSTPQRLVVVTKQATGAPAQIHHRCPMVVRDDEVNAWIDPRCTPLPAASRRETSMRKSMATSGRDEVFRRHAVAAGTRQGPWLPSRSRRSDCRESDRGHRKRREVRGYGR